MGANKQAPIVWCWIRTAAISMAGDDPGNLRTPQRQPGSKSWMADNPPRPGQILNHVEPRRYPTRHSICQSGISLELYDTVLNDTFRKPVTLSNMSVMPDDIAKLGKQLGAMFVRLEPFEGTQNIKDFFQDFERYLKQTATTSDSDKLNSLIDHTTGEACAFYRALTPAPNYAELKTALEDCFGLNIQEKRQIKSSFYSTKQLPGESLKMYMGRMQQMARQIEVPDSEVLEVCINGARTELRPHLAMAAPDSVKDLLKLAVVANESLVADSNPQFEELNAVTAQLQQFERRMTALHDANTNRQQPPRNSRPQQRRPRGQQRNNGPRFQQTIEQVGSESLCPPSESERAWRHTLMGTRCPISAYFRQCHWLVLTGPRYCRQHSEWDLDCYTARHHGVLAEGQPGSRSGNSVVLRVWQFKISVCIVYIAIVISFMKWSLFSNLFYPFYYAHSCIWIMKIQSCLWSRPSSRGYERLNVITIADVNTWISMVISHRKCHIPRFCVSLMQVSMCMSISNCFSDNVSFWRVMSYLYEVTSCVR